MVNSDPDQVPSDTEIKGIFLINLIYLYFHIIRGKIIDIIANDEILYL